MTSISITMGLAVFGFTAMLSLAIALVILGALTWEIFK